MTLHLNLNGEPISEATAKEIYEEIHRLRCPTHLPTRLEILFKFQLISISEDKKSLRLNTTTVAAIVRVKNESFEKNLRNNGWQKIAPQPQDQAGVSTWEQRKEKDPRKEKDQKDLKRPNPDPDDWDSNDGGSRKLLPSRPAKAPALITDPSLGTPRPSAVETDNPLLLSQLCEKIFTLESRLARVETLLSLSVQHQPIAPEFWDRASMADPSQMGNNIDVSVTPDDSAPPVGYFGQSVQHAAARVPLTLVKMNGGSNFDWSSSGDRRMSSSEASFDPDCDTPRGPGCSSGVYPHPSIADQNGELVFDGSCDLIERSAPSRTPKMGKRRKNKGSQNTLSQDGLDTTQYNEEEIEAVRALQNLHLHPSSLLVPFHGQQQQPDGNSSSTSSTHLTSDGGHCTCGSKPAPPPVAQSDGSGSERSASKAPPVDSDEDDESQEDEEEEENDKPPIISHNSGDSDSLLPVDTQMDARIGRRKHPRSASPCGHRRKSGRQVGYDPPAMYCKRSKRPDLDECRRWSPSRHDWPIPRHDWSVARLENTMPNSRIEREAERRAVRTLAPILRTYPLMTLQEIQQLRLPIEPHCLPALLANRNLFKTVSAQDLGEHLENPGSATHRWCVKLDYDRRPQELAVLWSEAVARESNPQIWSIGSQGDPSMPPPPPVPKGPSSTHPQPSSSSSSPPPVTSPSSTSSSSSTSSNLFASTSSHPIPPAVSASSLPASVSSSSPTVGMPRKSYVTLNVIVAPPSASSVIPPSEAPGALRGTRTDSAATANGDVAEDNTERQSGRYHSPTRHTNGDGGDHCPPPISVKREQQGS